MRLPSSNIIPAIVPKLVPATNSVDNTPDDLPKSADKIPVVRSSKPIAQNPPGGPVSSMAKDNINGGISSKTSKQSFTTTSERMRMRSFDDYQSKRSLSGHGTTGTESNGFNLDASDSSLASTGVLGRGVFEDPAVDSSSESKVVPIDSNSSQGGSHIAAVASSNRKIKRRTSGLSFSLSREPDVVNASPLPPGDVQPIIDIETVKSLDGLIKNSDNSNGRGHLRVKKRPSDILKQLDSDSASCLSSRGLPSAEVSIASSTNVPMSEGGSVSRGRVGSLDTAASTSKSQSSITSNGRKNSRATKRASILSKQQDSNSISSLSSKGLPSAEVSIASSANIPTIEETTIPRGRIGSLDTATSKSQSSINSNSRMKKRTSILSKQPESDSASSLSSRGPHYAESSSSSSSSFLSVVEEASSVSPLIDSLMETLIPKINSLPPASTPNPTHTIPKPISTNLTPMPTSPNPSFPKQRRTTLGGPASAPSPLKQTYNTSATSSKTSLAKSPSTVTIVTEKKQKLIQAHNRRQSLDIIQRRATLKDRKSSDEDEDADEIEKIFMDEVSKPTNSVSMSSESQSNIQSRGSQQSTNSKLESMIKPKIKMKKVAKRAVNALKSRLSPSSKDFWRSLVISVKLATRSSRIAQKITLAKFKELQEPASKMTEKTLTELLQDMAKDADNACSYKLKNLLQIPPRQRDYDLVQKINTIMNERIPDFAKAFIDEQERLQICKYLRFDFLKKDTVLLWEEHICTCFYFLIYGRVDIFKLNKGSKLKLAVMKAGAIFGHARIKVENATRSACAVLLQDSLLLTIERDDYVSYKQDLTSLHPKVTQLSNLSFFASNKDVFEKLSRFFQLGMYKAGSVIHNQSSSLSRVYWVVDGEIVVSQKIGIVTYRKTLRPFDETIDEPLGPEHHLSYLNLETNRLGPGSWFPKLPEVGKGAHLVQYLGAEYLDSGLYREHFLEKKVELRVPYAIHAEKDTILASVSFAEIGQIMPREILYELVYVAMVHSFPTADLQEQYLQQVTWEGHKKRELDDLKQEKNRKDAVDFNFDL